MAWYPRGWRAKKEPRKVAPSTRKGRDSAKRMLFGFWNQLPCPACCCSAPPLPWVPPPLLLLLVPVKPLLALVLLVLRRPVPLPGVAPSTAAPFPLWEGGGPPRLGAGSAVAVFVTPLGGGADLVGVGESPGAPPWCSLPLGVPRATQLFWPPVSPLLRTSEAALGQPRPPLHLPEVSRAVGSSVMPLLACENSTMSEEELQRGLWKRLPLRWFPPPPWGHCTRLQSLAAATCRKTGTGRWWEHGRGGLGGLQRAPALCGVLARAEHNPEPALARNTAPPAGHRGAAFCGHWAPPTLASAPRVSRVKAIVDLIALMAVAILLLEIPPRTSLPPRYAAPDTRTLLGFPVACLGLYSPCVGLCHTACVPSGA